MVYIVSIKPAEGPGPILVSDDPAVVQATLEAIHRQYQTDDQRRQSIVPIARRTVAATPPAG
jgi:hypothetical protein